MTPGTDLERPEADRWLDELSQLRADPDGFPVGVWTMRTFAVRAPHPFQLADPFVTAVLPRGIEAVTVALYETGRPDAPADLLVPVDPLDAPLLPWTAEALVRGIVAPGHAVALTIGAHTVYPAGPATVPQLWRRRYRNRPWRWPPRGGWDDAVGSALGEG